MKTNEEFIHKKEDIKVEEKYYINISLDLLNYLCDDYSYRNTRRFSRLQAFLNLVERNNIAKIKKEESGASIEVLSKSWKWSRPTVMRYIQDLEKMNCVEIANVVTRKLVRLRQGIVIYPSQNDSEK